MVSKEFAQLTLAELHEITGINSSRWSRYFSHQQTISEKSLEAAGHALGMTAAQLLEAINHKRLIPLKRGRPRKGNPK